MAGETIYIERKIHGNAEHDSRENEISSLSALRLVGI